MLLQKRKFPPPYTFSVGEHGQVSTRLLGDQFRTTSGEHQTSNPPPPTSPTNCTPRVEQCLRDAGANCMAMSLAQGRRVTLSKVDAFADGVAVKSVRPPPPSPTRQEGDPFESGRLCGRFGCEVGEPNPPPFVMNIRNLKRKDCAAAVSNP